MAVGAPFANERLRKLVSWPWGQNMIPVNTAMGQSNKTSGASRKTSGGGQASEFSLVYSDEEQAYANVGRSGFGADRSASPAAAQSSGGLQGAAAADRNRFQDFFDAHASAVAGAAGNNARDASYANAVWRQASTGPDAQGQMAPKREPTFSISMAGNQIQLAFNPNSR